MHFAEVDSNNIVLRVVSASSLQECIDILGNTHTWIETFMQTPGKNHASTGYHYHPEQDDFSAPQPYPSWTIDSNLIWQPPISYPDEESLVIPSEFTNVNLSILDKIALQTMHNPSEEAITLYKWMEDIQEWVVFQL